MNTHEALNYGVKLQDIIIDKPLLPEGEYEVRIRNYQIRTNRTRTGHYVKIAFELMENKYAGIKIFENFNLKHHDPEVVEIGFKWLKTLCLACGLSGEGMINEVLLKQLIGKRLTATIVIDTNAYGQLNRIRYYKKVKLKAMRGLHESSN